jgi:hypothetical protein
MTFAQIKRDLRRLVHDTFAVSATYQDASMLHPVDLRVRLHTRRASPFGDMEGAGFAEVIENVDRVVFDKDELSAKGLTPCPKGVVSFPDYGMCVRLDVREPSDGPIREAWRVVR